MLITRVAGAARRAGVSAGEELVSVNGSPVSDILDVRFYTYEPKLRLELRGPDGAARFVALGHSEGSDIGLTFESDLPGGGRTCRNSCVFCFVDQNPPGCRESLYVKDDDARLSFLQGNYITLTNLSEQDIERICRMKIGPLGISVHTTDPELRVKMLRNRFAGNCLPLMRRLAGAGVRMNAQIVLCPGWNDGPALGRTLRDLLTLGEALISVSVVPVGLTAHRPGLTPLRPVSPADALSAIEMKFPRVWCSDEMYLRAGLPLPPAEFYDGFPQLENGVGMLPLFIDEWQNDTPPPRSPRAVKTTVATGLAAAPFLKEMLRPYPFAAVVPVKNRFFGETVDVAGLLTGGDLFEGLRDRDLGGRVLIPSSMLRRGEEVFLDGMTVGELSENLGVTVTPVEPDAASLREKLND